MNIEFIALEPRRDWMLVSRKLGLRYVDDTKGILAVDVEKFEPVAGVVLNNWTYNAVQAHFWVDNPFVLRHGFLEEVANYIFNTAGKNLIIGFVPADNEEALKLDKHIGFRETYRIPGGYMYDVDYVILEATREDLARWLPAEVEHGQERRARSA